MRDIASVSSAIARGDLSRTVTVDVRGEMLELKETVNSLVDQLRTFASEVCVCRISLRTVRHTHHPLFVPGNSCRSRSRD